MNRAASAQQLRQASTMNLLVSTEARFDRTPDGAVWTHTVFDRAFWDRYLTVFNGVRVLARVRDVERVPTTWRRVDGDGVLIAPLPHFQGPWQYMQRRRHVVAAIDRAVAGRDAVLLRLPSVFASLVRPHLQKTRRPYAVEVVGDPSEIFQASLLNPLFSVLRLRLAQNQRSLCSAAVAVAYVTKHVLQRRYPAAAAAVTTHYSSIDLEDEAFVARPRTWSADGRTRTLIAVGSLAQMYKGADVLLDALKMLLAAGVDVRAVWVGDGVYRKSMEQRAARLHLGDRIRFLGELLPGAGVVAELDRADLFVLPSRSEGLPRAMIEAMARALPCVGSSVGGVTELLQPEDMVPPGEPEALAATIGDVLKAPGRMTQMSARNLTTALNYRSCLLRERREGLYRSLRDYTDAWARERHEVENPAAVSAASGCNL